MNNLYFPAVISSRRLMCSILLSLFTFVIFAGNADARSRYDGTTTSTSRYSDHGITSKCDTNEAVWDVYSGTAVEISQTIGNLDAAPGSVNYPENPMPENVIYMICAGFDTDDYNTIDAIKYGSLMDEFGNPTALAMDRSKAKYGWGRFTQYLSYTSSNNSSSIEDLNNGDGNDCDFDDSGNQSNNTKPNKKTGDCTPTISSKHTCTDILPHGSGAIERYKFYCADGTDVIGQRTLIPWYYKEGSDWHDEDAIIPEFTNCGLARVLAGKCTIQYNHLPTITIKIKGVETLISDAQGCLESFNAKEVINGLGTNQTQILGDYEILRFERTSYAGSCDIDTGLPEYEGSPTAAYNVHCTSDLDAFYNEDNVDGNRFFGDGEQYGLTGTIDGYDNVNRECHKRKGSPNPPHTGDYELEKINLSDGTIDVAGMSVLNCNCTTGTNTDSGKTRIQILDQASVLAKYIVVERDDVGNIVSAPLLEGVSPINAVIVDVDGVPALELTYPTCPGLSYNVIHQDPLNLLTSEDNNTPQTLHLTGDIQPKVKVLVDEEVVEKDGLRQSFSTTFETKVNGLPKPE